MRKKAFALIKLVQIASPSEYRLSLIVDDSSCDWLLAKKTDAKEIKKGTSFKELLELLNEDEIIEIKGFEHANWMSV